MINNIVSMRMVTAALEKTRIAVAMSTYNGEKYITEQIDSILSQSLPETAEVTLYVRDDGSTDKSCAILKEYESRNRLIFSKGNNIGVCSSFLSLLKSIPLEYDYVALCDQDDVWHKDKLSRAISVLSSTNQSIPQLYCSEYIFCDANLNPIGKSNLNKAGVSFVKLLFENVCSGNTMVLNCSLHRLASSVCSDGAYCHDWWLALLASSQGEIHFDRTFFSLDYRRIGTNASPTGLGFIELLRYRLSKFIQGNGLESIKDQLQALLDATSETISERNASILRLYLSNRRILKAFSVCRLRQTMPSELALRILFLLGKL